MPMTLQQLKTQLSDIEPTAATYTGIGAAEVPLLGQLLKDPEPWVASRAVFALSHVNDAGAMTMLTHAIADPREEVRVAVAASAANLKPADQSRVLLPLLSDREVGVRKFALHAVSGVPDAVLAPRLKEIEERDEAPMLRDLAKAKRLQQ